MRNNQGLFDDGCSDLCEVILHCSFDLYFSNEITQLSPTLCDPKDYTVHGFLQARILEWVAILQGIFPTQELNPGVPHCWQILYQLSRCGSPRILEWVAYPFSSGSS